MRHATLNLFVIPLLLAGSALAEEKPLWELGAGVAALSLPDYRGAEQSHGHLLPIPYLVYRGDRLKIDRDQVRGLLFKSERSEWDISLGAAVPVKSDDNRARAGMPDLDPTVEVGPQWSYILKDDRYKLTLRLPLRRVLAVDMPDMNGIGVVFTPTLALDRDDHPWAGWHTSMSTGPLFGNRGYFDYYYGVDAAQAAPGRPAWRAGAGYGGWQWTATLTRRYKDIWVGGFLRGDYLGGADFQDSPLAKKELTWMGGIGIAWVFARSDETASARR